MPQPNFIIMGAPKCGTTALSEYLRQHPNVFMSTPKEVHFFATDFPRHGVADTLDEYLELFADAHEGHTAIGEASVWHLYSREAAQNIRDFDPDMKLIVMLRNPVELVPSMHSQNLFSLADNEPDFRKAWGLSETRRRGKHLPKGSTEAALLFYDEIAKLGEQLERLLTVFPEEQVKVVFYDDFSAETGQVYREILRFLEIPEDHDVPLIPFNRNKTHRFRWSGSLTQRPPTWLKWTVRGFKQVTGIPELKVMDRLKKWDNIEVTRPPLDPEMTQIVLDNYREDILKLAELTGRDLNPWLNLPKQSLVAETAAAS